MSTPKKYRKKPVKIEAWQWTKDSEAEQIIDWIETDSDQFTEWDEGVAGPSGPDGEDWGLFVIHTLEGDMEVAPFDYVICGVEGEFYACKPSIFNKSYEAVDQ